MSRNETNEKMERLSPSELDHVTMAVTADVNDLSPSEVEHLLNEAESFENEFKQIVEDVKCNSNED